MQARGVQPGELKAHAMGPPHAEHPLPRGPGQPGICVWPNVGLRQLFPGIFILCRHTTRVPFCRLLDSCFLQGILLVRRKGGIGM